MRLQSNGWRAKDNAHQARKAHQALIAKLKRERIYDEFTPADIESRLSVLKADFLARDAQRRAAA